MDKYSISLIQSLKCGYQYATTSHNFKSMAPALINYPKNIETDELNHSGMQGGVAPNILTVRALDLFVK